MPRPAKVILGLLVAVALVFFGVRGLVRRHLESPDFRRELALLATSLVSQVDPELAVELPSLKVTGFLAARLGGVRLLRGDAKVLSLGGWGDFDVFPTLLVGQLAFRGGATVAEGGRVSLVGRLPAGRVWDFLDGEMPPLTHLHAQLVAIDAASLGAFWPELVRHPRVALVSGTFAGTVSQGQSQGDLRINVTAEKTRWRLGDWSPTPVTLGRWQAALSLAGRRLKLLAPLTLSMPLGQATFSGEIDLGPTLPTWRLVVEGGGGLPARLALAKLLRCQQLPTRDRFAVTGALGSPRCR